MKNQKGFSLIELLVVIVVIGIIASIAIPNIIAARRAAYEGAATSNLRVLHNGIIVYARTAGGGLYTDNLNTLAVNRIIDPELGTGSRSGYIYILKMDPTAKISYTIGAIPLVASGVSQTGTRKFCVATEGIFRSENDPAFIGTNISNDGDCNETNYRYLIQ